MSLERFSVSPGPMLLMRLAPFPLTPLSFGMVHPPVYEPSRPPRLQLQGMPATIPAGRSGRKSLHVTLDAQPTTVGTGAATEQRREDGLPALPGNNRVKSLPGQQLPAGRFGLDEIVARGVGSG